MSETKFKTPLKILLHKREWYKRTRAIRLEYYRRHYRENKEYFRNYNVVERQRRQEKNAKNYALFMDNLRETLRQKDEIFKKLLNKHHV